MNSARTRKPPTTNAPLVLSLILLCSVLLGAQAPAPDVNRVDAVVKELQTELRIPEEVRVTVARVNEKLVSVERTSTHGSDQGGFVMCFEKEFLLSLDEQELRAAVAHELGHVWIFTHHPYLQTEALANEVAMRVVSRSSLMSVYHKLWSHQGIAGDVDELLGAENNR